MSDDRRMHLIDLDDPEEGAKQLVEAVRDAGDNQLVVMPQSTYLRLVGQIPGPSAN